METIFFSLYFPLAHLSTSAYLLWAVLFIVTFGTTLQVTLLKHADSQWTPSRFSLHFTRLWAALRPLSLSPELENRKTKHSHRPEEQFRGEGSFKKLFSVWTTSSALFCSFCVHSTSPVLAIPFHPLILFCLSSLHPQALYPFFFPPGDVLQTQYSWRGIKTDDFWLPPPLSLFLPLLKGRHSVCCEVSELVGVTKVCVCVSGVRDYVCLTVALLKRVSRNRCTCVPSLNNERMPERETWRTET